MLKYLSRNDIKETTKKNRLLALRLALRATGRLTDDISRIIDGFKCNKGVEPCPTDREIKEIISSRRNVRDKLMLSLMAYSGLRISEVVGLEMSDINLEQWTLRLRNTKGKQDAYLPIVHKSIKENLLKYFGERQSSSPNLFVSCNGKPLQVNSAKTLVLRWCRALELPYHAHSFRRYFANTLSRNNIPVQYIMTAMRHKNIATTMTYLNINGDDVRQVLSKVYKKKGALI